MEVFLQKETNKEIFSDFVLLRGLQSQVGSQKNNFYEEEFYHRYKSDIYKIVVQKCRMFRDSEELAKDIIQDTFISAFSSIKKFKLPSKSTQKEHRKIILKWLITIANNCFYKEYAKMKNKLAYDDIESLLGESVYNNLLVDSDGSDVLIPNPIKLKLQNSLTLLSEKEYHIITVYADEFCIQTSRHLSDKSLKYLCTLYETTPENIRQIKKRALDKIKKHCFKN